MFVGSVTLEADRALGTSNATTIALGRTLTLDGGALTTSSFAGDGDVVFNAGTLNVTGAGGFSISDTGPLGSVLSLNPATKLNVTNTLAVIGGALVVIEPGAMLSAGNTANNGEIVLGGQLARINGTTVTNSGLIHGDGRINATVFNQTFGEVRIGTGDRIHFNEASMLNAGLLSLQGGTAEFTINLSNEAGGNIVGRGTLNARDITNAGDIALSNGQTDIFGDLTNLATGRVMVSGNADVTFWDDVVDIGTLFNVSAGSSVTFFGDAGFGVSGGGDVYFEADITPGNSPGLETFGGNVYFGALAGLEIELQGAARGTGYDALDIAGTAQLGGTLELIALNGFVPGAGQTFDVLASSELIGQFGNVLPGERLEMVDGLGSFVVHYGAGSPFGSDRVVLSDFLTALLSADFNQDGSVNLLDLDILGQNWQQAGTSGTGDANGDGLVNLLDLDLLGQQWGSSASFAAALDASGLSVPEPASAALVLVGGLALVRRRKD